MGQVRITADTRFERDGKVYIVRTVLPNRQLVVELEGFGVITTISRDDLYMAWAQNEVRFALIGPNIVSPTTPTTITTRYTFADFAIIPEKQRAEAWRRYQIILPLLRRRREERTRKHIEAYVHERKQQMKLQATTEESTPQKGKGGRAGINIGQALSGACTKRYRRAREARAYR